MSVDGALTAIARFSVRQPWTVVGLGVVAVALALSLAAGRLTLRTSNLDLIDQDLPEVRRFTDFAREFGTPNVLVAVLEGDDPESLAAAVDELGPTLREVEGVRGVLDRKPLDPEIDASLQPDPYFSSFDQTLFFMFVQPDDPLSRAETIGPFVEGVRAAIEGAGVERPGVEIGLTGLPQYALDDRDTIRADVSRLSWVSLGLVLLVFLTGFGSFARPLLAVVALLAAVAVTLGAAAAYPGHLTLLSAFFASILLGLGVDFGIHVVDRLEELLADGESHDVAVVGAVTSLSRSLTTSALTTATLFFAMLFSGFRGFEELGLISGTGVLACFLAMVSLLPALLVITRRRRRSRRAGERRIGRWVAATQSRVWASLLGATVAVAVLFGGPGFDTDYLNLQPEGSEAVRLERQMVELSGYSTQFAAFTVENRQQAVELTERLFEEASVGAVRSILETGVEVALARAPAPSTEPLRRMLVSPEGRYAVYAYPTEDIWAPDEQQTFVTDMQAIDPEVTGMPVLGSFMVERSRRALRLTALLGVVVLLGCVYLDFRSLVPTLLAVSPTLMAIAAMLSLMRSLDLPFNPLNVMALPVVLGIAVDDGVHLVHRFLAEDGDVRRTLVGTGRSIFLTSITTIAAFGTLAFSAHRGLASFAQAITLGVGSALVLSLWLLPVLLVAARSRLRVRSGRGIETENVASLLSGHLGRL